MSEHLRRQLDAHPDVHAVGARGDLQVAANRLHPLTAGASGGNDALCARKHLSAADDGKAFLRLADLLHRRIEMELHLGGQLLVQVLQHDIVYIGSEMPHRSIQKVQSVLEAHLFDVAVGSGVQRGSLPSVGKVDLINIFHQVDRLLFADILVQSAAELVRDVVFAVRECARSAEAVHDGTGLAVDAGLDLITVDRTVPLLQRVARLQHRHLPLGLTLHQFIGGKDAAGARADNQNIIFHNRRNPPSFGIISRGKPLYSIPEAAAGHNSFFLISPIIHHICIFNFSIPAESGTMGKNSQGVQP